MLLTTDPGDLVLDPFLGSGTTAEVCKQAGRDFTGIELSADYAAKARRRVELARAAPAADRSITSRCS